MYTLLDYITFRGDLRKSERDFGEADYAILADFAYLAICPVYETLDSTDLRDVVKELQEAGKLPIKKVVVTEDMEKLDLSAGMCDRFGTIGVKDPVDLYNKEDDIQFAAVTWDFKDGSACVMFRGTDDTVTGWKEDFIAAYTESKSQKLAVGYLRNALKRYRSVTVGGHSKGGNLALYAAAKIPEEERENLEHLWLFDSPGLYEGAADPDILKKLDVKITFINPAESIVGRIFETEYSDHKIVESNAISLMAHEMSTWKMDGLHFLQTENYTQASNVTADLVRKQLDSIPVDERKSVIDGMFARLENSSIQSVTELKESFRLEDKAVQTAENVKEAARSVKEKILTQLNLKHDDPEDDFPDESE